MSNTTRIPIDQTTAMLKRIKKMPPKPRLELLTYLRKEYGLRVDDLIRGAADLVTEAEVVGCSMPVIEDVTVRGCRAVRRGRVLARGYVRIGDSEGVYPTRRHTPKPAVRMEDRYDLMTTEEADWCKDPPSSTGMQIALIRIRKGTEKEQSGILKAAKKNSRIAR